jgi:hypothetical protein
VISPARAAIAALFSCATISAAIVAQPGFAAIPHSGASRGLVLTDTRQPERVPVAAAEALPTPLHLPTLPSGSGQAEPQVAARSTVPAPAPSTASTASTVPKKAAPPAQPKPKPQAKPNSQPSRTIAPGIAPGRVNSGHYIRSLNGDPVHDRKIMQLLGYEDARKHHPGQRYLVLLDIGGQLPGGMLLSTTHQFISNAAMVHAVKAYVDGYHQGQYPYAPVMIAIGTNNDLHVSQAQGQTWASKVVEPVRKHAAPHRDIEIAGANDIEPGFGSGPRETKAWLRGYLTHTKARFVFNGSADGCSNEHSRSVCNKGWTMHDLAYVAGGAAPERILVLPQIYNVPMAYQWALISRTAVLDGYEPLRIIGPLTETAACGSDPTCPTMPSRDAWLRLWRALHEVHPNLKHTLPVQTDLDVR